MGGEMRQESVYHADRNLDVNTGDIDLDDMDGNLADTVDIDLYVIIVLVHVGIPDIINKDECASNEERDSHIFISLCFV